MPAIALVGLIALAAPQTERCRDESERDILNLIEKLGADSVEERSEAERQLRLLQDDRLPLLRKALVTVRDSEIDTRLWGIIRSLLLRRANSKYSEGKLDEALFLLAEAERAPNPGDFVQERLKTARERLSDFILLRSDLTDLAVVQQADFGLVADRVKKEGLWGFYVLVEMLGEKENSSLRSRAPLIILKMGKECASALCWATKSKDGAVRSSACELLGRLGIETPLASETLRRVYFSDECPSAKKAALDAFVRITGAPPKESSPK